MTTSMLESVPHTAFEVDDKGRVPSYNFHALSFLGYQPRSLPQGLSFVELVVPEERAQAARQLTRWLEGDCEKAWSHTLQKADGSTVEAVLEGVPCLRSGRLVALTINVFAE
ncbi:MAG: PAS domain-containing protein [Pseudomonadota bacterium]